MVILHIILVYIAYRQNQIYHITYCLFLLFVPGLHNVNCLIPNYMLERYPQGMT
jgi:hypothetical protein